MNSLVVFFNMGCSYYVFPVWLSAFRGPLQYSYTATTAVSPSHTFIAIPSPQARLTQHRLTRTLLGPNKCSRAVQGLLHSQAFLGQHVCTSRSVEDSRCGERHPLRGGAWGRVHNCTVVHPK